MNEWYCPRCGHDGDVISSKRKNGNNFVWHMKCPKCKKKWNFVAGVRKCMCEIENNNVAKKRLLRMDSKVIQRKFILKFKRILNEIGNIPTFFPK